MNLKNWTLLLLVYVLYLCIGGLIFNALECPFFQETREAEYQKMKNLTKALDRFELTLNPAQTRDFEQILEYVSFGEPGEKIDEDDCEKWDFYNSLFFAFTAVTTIGYGHQAPITNTGRMACVFYSLLGIPLNAILIGAMGNLFSKKVAAMKTRVVAAGGKGQRGIGKAGRILLEGLVWFLIFTSLFLFLPAAFFTYGGLEDESWEYVDSVYYTFITLSTIGFGDMVAGRKVDHSSINPVAKMMYQVAIIVWIIFGLGFIFGVVNVLTEAMQSTSKPVKRVFRGLKNQIHVQEYWRKILNEIVYIKQESLSGELLEVGAGGGSEPCMGELNLEDSPRKRSVSTGDIAGACQNKDDNLLSVPGEVTGMSLQSLHNTNALPDIEELNEDTITSLRQFLITSNLADPGGDGVRSWIENNFPGDNGMTCPPTRQVSRKPSSSFKHNHTVIPGPDRRQRLSLNHNPRKLGRRHSTHSNRSTTSFRSTVSSGPVGLLLERTSLGEFLTAVENVRAMSEAELMVTEENETKHRKNSMFRKLSQMGRRESSNEEEGPMTLTQVTRLLSFKMKSEQGNANGGNNVSNNPLMGSPSNSDRSEIVTVAQVTPPPPHRDDCEAGGARDNLHM